MATFTVENVDAPPREWQSQYGPMLSYTLALKDHGVAEISQKPTSPAPKAGDSIEGELVPSTNGNFPPKLKRAKPQGGPGGYGPRPEDPERAKRIVRQHSQEMALRYMAAKGVTKFMLDDDFRKVIDWFDRDASQ